MKVDTLRHHEIALNKQILQGAFGGLGFPFADPIRLRRGEGWRTGRVFLSLPKELGNLPGMSEVTRILESLGIGESESSAELLPLVYGELRQLAAAKMAGERAGHTLQATALVHEAWIKLVEAEGGSLEWNGRQHFYAAAAEAMRRILIDHARRKLAARRGGEWLEITFGDFKGPAECASR